MLLSSLSFSWPLQCCSFIRQFDKIRMKFKLVILPKQKHQYKCAVNAGDISKATNNLLLPRGTGTGCIRGVMLILSCRGKILIRHKTVHQLWVPHSHKAYPAYKSEKGNFKDSWKREKNKARNATQKANTCKNHSVPLQWLFWVLSGIPIQRN